MIKKLAKYMKGLWFLALISASGMIIEAVCELALPSIANSIYEKHKVLTRFLCKMGVSESVAEKDACRMEHVISEETFLKIKQIAEGDN